MFINFEKKMKMTKKLLLSLCVLSGAAFGQSFTSANEFQIGNTQAMYLCDSAAPTYATTTGSGAFWDYSSYMKMPNPDRTYQIITNANASFPNANKVINIQGVLDTYIKSDNANRSSEGFQFTDQTLGTVTANFSAGDNLNIMDYDFTLAETVSDVFSGTLTGTGVINPACSGTSVSTFDGIGSIKLSNTITTANVQRHHLYTELNGTTILGPVILKIDQFEYFDFANSNLPVLSFTHLKIFLNGSQATSLKFLLNSVDPVGFVSLNENSNSEFSVYPNPSSDEINISSENLDGTETFNIVDVTGKTVFTSKNSSINVSKLIAGVYFVEIEKNGITTQEKFVKK